MCTHKKGVCHQLTLLLQFNNKMGVNVGTPADTALIQVTDVIFIEQKKKTNRRTHSKRCV